MTLSSCLLLFFFFFICPEWSFKQWTVLRTVVPHPGMHLRTYWDLITQTVNRDDLGHVWPNSCSGVNTVPSKPLWRAAYTTVVFCVGGISLIHTTIVEQVETITTNYSYPQRHGLLSHSSSFCLLFTLMLLDSFSLPFIIVHVQFFC